MTAQPDLIERYQRELGAHGYQADAAQQVAIGRLQVLRTRWLAERRAGIWSRLRRRLWASTPDGARSGDTRGLYLWGGVGRGKTWMVDLFYDSLPTRERRRAHFHHFMRSIHEQLRQIGARRNPLQLLAHRIARQTRLLCLDEPTMGLAPRFVERVLEAIVAIAAAGMSVFMVEQNVGLALQIAGRGYVLAGGAIVASGSAANLRGAEAVRDAYLGSTAERA